MYYLGFMPIMDSGNGFQFEDNFVLNNKICQIFSYHAIFIVDNQWFFFLIPNISQIHFIC